MDDLKYKSKKQFDELFLRTMILTFIKKKLNYLKNYVLRTFEFKLVFLTLSYFLFIFLFKPKNHLSPYFMLYTN